MCSTYAWRSTGIPFCSRDGHTTVARPRSIRAPCGQTGRIRTRGARCRIRRRWRRLQRMQRLRVAGALAGCGRSAQELPDSQLRGGHPVRRRDIDPDQPRIAAQPGLLMSNVAMGVEPNSLDCLLETRLSAQIRQQLAVSETAHGRGALRNAALEQGPYLGDQPSLDLIADPIVYSPIERVARHRQANLEGFKRRRAFALLSRHGDAG